MKVIIIDDDNLVAISLKTILESDDTIEVVAIENKSENIISLYKHHKPDVILMDIQMAGMTGLQSGEKLLSFYPDAKILYLTTFVDNEYIVEALRIGAKGYILKQNFESIVPSIKAVYMGQRVFGDDIMSKIPSLINGENFDFRKHNLNEKEYKILKLVADGLNNKEISNELFLSEGTVRNYLSNILEKLSLRDRTQLAIFYYKNKL